MLLRYQADWRSLLFLGVHLVLLFGQRFGVFSHWGLYLLCFPLAFIAGIIAHNHMHLGIFRGRHANNLFSLILMFGSGMPPTRLVTSHNERHHQHTNEEQDFVRCSLVRFRWNWLNVLLYPLAGMMAIIRERPNDFKRWKAARPRLFGQAVRERIVYYLVVGTLLIENPGATLVFCILPWFFGQLAMVGINLIQHQHCNVHSRWNHSRNVTGPIANWFLLNNGYHTAHHNWPSLHWSKLPAWHRRYVEPEIAPDLNYRTMVGAIVSRLITPEGKEQADGKRQL